MVLVLDDAQWCDRETLTWLHYFLRFNILAPLLVVTTVRTDEIPRDAQRATSIFPQGTPIKQQWPSHNDTLSLQVLSGALQQQQHFAQNFLARLASEPDEWPQPYS